MGSGWCSWWSLHCDSSHPKVKTKADLEFRRACSPATRKEPNSHGNIYIAASKGRWEASLALHSSSKYSAVDWRGHFLNLFAALLLAWWSHSRAGSTGLQTQECSNGTVILGYLFQFAWLPSHLILNRHSWFWLELMRDHGHELFCSNTVGPHTTLAVVVKTCTYSQRLSR